MQSMEVQVAVRTGGVRSMVEIAVASVAFAAGGALMKWSAGFSRFLPSAAIAVLFLLGAAAMARAVTTDGMTTTFIVGLGIEAVASVAMGVTVLGERLGPAEWGGIGLIVAGVGMLRW